MHMNMCMYMHMYMHMDMYMCIYMYMCVSERCREMGGLGVDRNEGVGEIRGVSRE